jgi:hypothetical protein
MGISPGNVGTMDYLDVYRRESQRDFGDGAGTLSRALVEGLFGIHPDALAGTLTVAPGFPEDWNHAKITHPDLTFEFHRQGLTDTYTVTQPVTHFKAVTFQIPALYDGFASIEVNGHPSDAISNPAAVGGPVLIVQGSGPVTEVRIAWRGNRIAPQGRVPQVSNLRPGTGAPQSTDGFTQQSQGMFTWWVPTTTPRPSLPTHLTIADWRTPAPATSLDPITIPFNDNLTNLFAPGKYLSPRSPAVSLELPSQGAGAWAGHLKELPAIDDTGLRAAGSIVLPNGVAFTIPRSGANVLFTSQWRNYPHEATMPLRGRARHLYLLMAGTTNFMQSRLDNGEILVTYTDGTTARLALRNPETWWPIEQDYFIDDYQFPYAGTLPLRVDLKTARVRLLDPASFKGQGREIRGGAATVLDLTLDPARQLKSLTVRTLANDVVIGLLAATLQH